MSDGINIGEVRRYNRARLYYSRVYSSASII